MTYHKTYHKEPSISKIYPYSIHTHEYEWYLRGFCFRDKILKTYSINQIMNMKCEKLTKKERRLLPENPDLRPVHRWDWESKELTGELINVKIKLTGRKAEMMKKKAHFIKEHPSQKMEIRGDAQVLVPEFLKNRIKSELREQIALSLETSFSSFFLKLLISV